MPTGIIPVVNTIGADYDLIVASQDWHPPDHKSFATEHPRKQPFDTIELHALEQRLWPVHCVQGSAGAAFPGSLDTRPVAAIFRKGMRPEVDSYSAFYDNGDSHQTGLAAFLRGHEVTHLDIAGLAADFCVTHTIVDALGEGFRVTLITSATRAINPTAWANKKAELLRHPGFRLK